MLGSQDARLNQSGSKSDWQGRENGLWCGQMNRGLLQIAVCACSVSIVPHIVSMSSEAQSQQRDGHASQRIHNPLRIVPSWVLLQHELLHKAFKLSVADCHTHTQCQTLHVRHIVHAHQCGPSSQAQAQG